MSAARAVALAAPGPASPGPAAGSHGAGGGAGGAAAPADQILVPVPPTARASRTDWLAFVSFALMVLLPVAVIGTYYARHAADQYTATARFTVREVQARPLAYDAADDAPERMGAGLWSEDVSSFTHVAASYLQSRGLLADLRRDIDLPSLFRVPEADFWARLPDGASAEDLHDYWRGRVRVAIDGPSGIVTLHVRAFRPDDAARLAQAMLARTEALVNALSLRQKRDALARAEAEAAESERRLAEAIAGLATFRDREGLLDPVQEANETVKLLAALGAERIRLETRLKVLGAVMDADAARAREVGTRLAKLREDIARLRESLAADATADANIAGALARYEALEIRRRFAERLYGLAQTRRIEAEIDLARQSIFLNVFDPPQRPEEARHPRRLAFTLIAFGALAAGWAVLALVVASVADHRMDRRG